MDDNWEELVTLESFNNGFMHGQNVTHRQGIQHRWMYFIFGLEKLYNGKSKCRRNYMIIMLTTFDHRCNNW